MPKSPNRGEGGVKNKWDGSAGVSFAPLRPVPSESVVGSVTVASRDILSHKRTHSCSLSSCAGGPRLSDRRGSLQSPAAPQLQAVSPVPRSSL
ncbi:hypothetical protein AOLI_G00100590 [Acnodon oligacanthus]